MNFYPGQLRVIVHYIDALDRMDDGLPDADPAPYMKRIALTDGEGTDWGTLADEVGGSWSWFLPEIPRPNGSESSKDVS